MGGQQSRISNNDDDDDEPPKCCFLLPAITGQPRKDIFVTNKDCSMGSPLPDTPLFVRRKRQGGGSGGGGMYSGLERELSSPAVNGNSVVLQHMATYGNSQMAAFYEGDDCEKRLREKYDLLEVLGVGSTSTVHRCVHKATGEQYACKIIDCMLIEERFQGMMMQFQTEIKALRQLQHPGIIRLYDVYVQPESKLFIVMEIMEGGELFDYVVQKGTLTELEAAAITRKITSALIFMHDKNIVHRDLKPENLLLKCKPKSNGSADSSIDVKIIDFGLSKVLLEEQQIASTFLGTRGYLAPEMLQRQEYTKAIDAWALGVIVFVLVCGCLPFDDDAAAIPPSVDSILQTKFKLRYPQWSSKLSPSVKDLLVHLLDVNPRTRYTAEQALRHEWVQGVTADKVRNIGSPGRLRKSPKLFTAGSGSIRTTPNARFIPPNKNTAAVLPATPPTPRASATMRRKGSI